MKFQDFPYSRPKEEEIQAKYEGFVKAFSMAKDFPSQLAVYQEVEEVEKEVSTMGTIAHVRFTINTKDSFYKDECDFYDAWGPVLQEKEQELAKLLLASPFVEEFRKELGDVAIKNMEMSMRSFSPAVVS